MSQELRGLGSLQRMRNTLLIKPSTRIADLGGGSGTLQPVKVQNLMTGPIVAEGATIPAETPKTTVQVSETETAMPVVQQAATTRSFSPVVFVKKYLNIGI